MEAAPKTASPMPFLKRNIAAVEGAIPSKPHKLPKISHARRAWIPPTLEEVRRLVDAQDPKLRISIKGIVNSDLTQEVDSSPQPLDTEILCLVDLAVTDPKQERTIFRTQEEAWFVRHEPIVGSDGATVPQSSFPIRIKPFHISTSQLATRQRTEKTWVQGIADEYMLRVKIDCMTSEDYSSMTQLLSGKYLRCSCGSSHVRAGGKFGKPHPTSPTSTSTLIPLAPLGPSKLMLSVDIGWSARTPSPLAIWNRALKHAAPPPTLPTPEESTSPEPSTTAGAALPLPLPLPTISRKRGPYKKRLTPNTTGSNGSSASNNLARRAPLFKRPRGSASQKIKLPTRARHPVPQPPPKITLFRSLTKRPLIVGEVLSDSDDSPDESWLDNSHVDAIRADPRLSKNQKDFLVLYDSHIRRLHLSGDVYLPDAIVGLVQSHKEEFRRAEMRAELAAKLASLRKVKVIDRVAMERCLGALGGVK